MKLMASISEELQHFFYNHCDADKIYHVEGSNGMSYSEIVFSQIRIEHFHDPPSFHE